MKKTIAPLTLAALVALAAPAGATAKAVPYVGKTSSGHKITFTVKNGNVHKLTAGIRMACIPIQGGGRPLGGSEVFSFTGYVPLRPHVRFSYEAKPAFHWREATWNNDLWLTRRGKRTIAGRMRTQYSFLISKFPIGTFVVYSCLGGGTFTAKPKG